MKKNNDYGFLFWIHLIITLLFVFSWVLISWWLIAIGAILLQIQYKILGGCVFSKAEFGSDEAFIPYYLKKWKLIKDKENARVFTTYYLPIITLIISLVWQVILGIRPLIF